MFIYINAAGCVNACRHCASSGHPPYNNFYSLNELQEIVREWGPVWPHFEATTHPEFPEIVGPLVVGDGNNYLPTTGFGLAEREAYKEVFSRLPELGYNGISFTLHGLEEKHDWFVCRKGAFGTIMKACRRAVEVGFTIHWNVFLDRQNPEDIPLLLELGKREFGIHSVWIGIPSHVVSRRSWLYEKLRPQLKDVKKLLQSIDPEMWVGPLKDRQVDEFTESALLRTWENEPDHEMLRSPFEPHEWPPVAPFDRVTLHIEKDRQVYLAPQCGQRIPLGLLSDGRDEILKRLQHVPAPPHSDISAAQAKAVLPESDSELLHPDGGSLRLKAISTIIYGST